MIARKILNFTPVLYKLKHSYLCFIQDGAAYISEVLDRISISKELDAVKNVDLVVEAIIENLAIKQQLFKTLDELAPP